LPETADWFDTLHTVDNISLGTASEETVGRFDIYKKIQGLVANRSAARAFALAASSSRFLAGAAVSSERRRRLDTAATSSTAARKDASLAFEGLLKPVILRTKL
jgi:hypothetical protein